MNAKSINNTNIQVLQKRDLLKLLESFRDDEYIAISFLDCDCEASPSICELNLLGVKKRNTMNGPTILLQVGL